MDSGLSTRGQIETLIEEWRKIHEQSEAIDATSRHDGHDWQSLCIGWCLAKGLSLEESDEFYSKMITMGLF